MRKLKLEVDALRVESFETAERWAEARGTVRGHLTGGGCGLPTRSCELSCDPLDNCAFVTIDDPTCVPAEC